MIEPRACQVRGFLSNLVAHDAPTAGVCSPSALVATEPPLRGGRGHDALAPVMGRIAACGRDAGAPCLSPPISGLTSSRIAACGRDARALCLSLPISGLTSSRIAACGRDTRAPCLSLPISGLTSSRIAACGRDARAPRRAGDAPQCPAVAEPNLPRTQACCRWGTACRAPTLQNDHRLLRQKFILSIDLIVLAPDARSRWSTALRFAAAGVLSRRARTRHSRSASGRMCAIFLPRACSRSFRSSESPVSALEMEVFRSMQRGGTDLRFHIHRTGQA